MIISVVNQKGGVGKTTTGINLPAGLALLDKKILIVDLDPQGNCSSGLGLDKAGDCIYDCIINGISAKSVIKHTAYNNLDILPSGISLAGAEVEMVNKDGREFLLKKVLDEVKNDYDYIFLDCPPSLGLLTVNALTACDGVLVPIQCEFFALEGLSQLVTTVKAVKNGLNPKLFIEGVVMTMYDSRTNLSNQVAEEVKKHFGDTRYNTFIPRNVRLSEAPSFAKSIMDYDKGSLGAQAYMDLAREFLDRRKDNGNE